jgi:chromosome segregation ATPase
MRLSFLCFVLLAGAVASSSLPIKTLPKSPTVSVVPPLASSQSKVENYVSVLKKDIDAQEASLKGYVSRVELERGSRQKRLTALTAVLNHLHEQLLNTTKYYHDYNSYVGDTQAKIRPLTVEFDRANALYTQTRTKLNEEKKFLDTLLAYIRNRQKC